MRKNSIYAKLTTFLITSAIAIATTGCVTSGLTGNSNNVLNEPRTEKAESETVQNNDTYNSGTGRYVERTVFEGDYWDRIGTQTLSNGQIVFINSATSQKFVSKDNGDTWNTENNDAFAEFIGKHYPTSTAVSKDGVLAIVSMDRKAGSENAEHPEYEYNLYIYNTDNTSKQIPIDLPDADSRLSEPAFDEKGNLYVYASGCGVIYKVDTNENTAEKLTMLKGYCHLMECKNNILMCMTSDKIFLYDIESKNFIEDETLDVFIKENYKEMGWSGGGFYAYSFLGNGNTVYVAGENGLYRHVIGGGVIEQVIDGGLSSLGTPSRDIVAMTMTDENEFLTAYNDGTIVKFTYDSNAPAIPNDRITVYGLNDDDTVRQAIAVYQAENPGVYIEYQIGIEEGGVTREDALKKLNTQLLSGSGPDVIMLDGMNIDIYVQKGVLMDLTDVVNEINADEGLYMNLIKNMGNDGKIYAVPTEFCIPAIGGQRDIVGSIMDYKSLADTYEKARETYPDTDIMSMYSANEIMKRFMPVCAPSWKDSEGKLDTRKIREYLEQSKRMYDIQLNGTPADILATGRQNAAGSANPYAKYRRSMGVFSYLSEQSPIIHGEIIDSHNYREMMSLQKTKGFEDASFKPLNGQSSNVYCPISIVGINAAAKNPDLAKQFVGTMLSSDVLNGVEFGLPINKKSLTQKFDYDENKLDENGGQYSESVVSKDGKSYAYTIYPVNQKGIDNLEKWIAGLDTPYLSDTVFETAVCTAGAAYIEGRQDIDKSVQAIADSVEIYLYE